jgi:hypothetical protein
MSNEGYIKILKEKQVMITAHLVVFELTGCFAHPKADPRIQALFKETKELIQAFQKEINE